MCLHQIMRSELLSVSTEGSGSFAIQVTEKSNKQAHMNTTVLILPLKCYSHFSVKFTVLFSQGTPTLFVSSELGVKRVHILEFGLVFLDFG